MPFKNPFFYSKHAMGKIGKIREQQKKEIEEGAPTPPSVNNYHVVRNLTVGKSVNVPVPVTSEEAELEPSKVNNFQANKPLVAKSLNDYPGKGPKKREVQEIIPAVNGKAAPELIHKPLVPRGQQFAPIIEKAKPKKRRARRKKKTS